MNLNEIAAQQIPDRLAGVLLGTALGDALGFVCEGMTAEAIARRFDRVEKFHLLGDRGYVTDDTEQSALIAQSLIYSPMDTEACTGAFYKSMIGWFLRMPFGIGRATLQSCLKMLCGSPAPGIRSAGNGSAMRAAVVGVFFYDNSEMRREYGRRLCEITHTDPRAVAGALYVAELSAACASRLSMAPTFECFAQAEATVLEPELQAALAKASKLAAAGAKTVEAAKELGTTGFVIHTVAFASFCFIRFGQNPLIAMSEAISGGGDTDSIGAIVGAWCGSLHGATGLPQGLIDKLDDGPFGRTHLERLAHSLARIKAGEPASAPYYNWSFAMVRNIMLIPVILSHALIRLFR